MTAWTYIRFTLPIEMQLSHFHPRLRARVMPNPRLRVTAGLPYSGKGTAFPIHQSGVADTHADLIPLNRTNPVRGAGRAPKP
jgi:hypothetical protein